ncbi:TadE/TadG family type IV pilus assembly protein [Kocuria rosea]|uniref:TadE/TadG family type IV pilus assembly protein n=1 Tax=Kocuria rosea TaxID=1275 RepID=UPI0009DE34FF|nr:TadE/TadG family type IV pilus assembly protein [Kocuria polaris]
MSCFRSARGAVAVEFALVLPLLLMILFAIIEFGHAYNVQISVTHAAREAARSMAVTQVWSDAVDAAQDSSPSLDPAVLTLTHSPAACAPGTPIEVTAQYPLTGLTGLMPAGITVTGRAAMQCGG